MTAARRHLINRLDGALRGIKNDLYEVGDLVSLLQACRDHLHMAERDNLEWPVSNEQYFNDDGSISELGARYYR